MADLLGAVLALAPHLVGTRRDRDRAVLLVRKLVRPVAGHLHEDRGELGIAKEHGTLVRYRMRMPGELAVREHDAFLLAFDLLEPARHARERDNEDVTLSIHHVSPSVW